MDGFKNKFIKLANDISEGNILSDELDNYVKENSNKTIFKEAIKSLMENNLSIVKVYAAKYSFEYKIDIKKSYYIARYILRKERDLVCKVEAKSIYDKYRRRHIPKITRIFSIRRRNK